MSAEQEVRDARTLREIRNRFGVKKVKEGDIYPEARRPGISDPDSERWIMLTHEQRLKRVVNALIDAGVHPGPTAVNVCCFRLPDKNLNGRDTRYRTEVLLARGYVKGPNGRWQKTAETRRSIDFRRAGLE